MANPDSEYGNRASRLVGTHSNVRCRYDIDLLSSVALESENI